jgi:hypothetical protein
MIDGDMSLKSKVLRERKEYIERKIFKERKENLEDFFKTNVDVMLENQKIILSVNERGELNAMTRKCYRELK